MMVKVGDKIRILCMDGEPQYTGKEGVVEKITTDPWRDVRLEGTWGGCAVYINKDCFEVIEEDKDNG